MLEYAVKLGFLAEHPFKGKIKKFREAWDNPRYLSPEEKTRLRAALRARDDSSREERRSLNRWRQERNHKPLPEIGLYSDYLTPLVLTAMLTGLRRGELINLSWQDIDPRAKTLQVKAKGARSGKTRTVPLIAECRDMLIEWKQLTEYGHPGGYVFPDRKGERLDNINTAFSNLLKAAEVTGLRFNDLRHHYASMLVQEGIQLYTVRELLGHSDLKMTQRYAHLAPDNLKEAARALDNIRSREVEQAELESFERRWYKPVQA
ncbi:MAG: site-specific integrase [Acidobacteriota bacterium]